MRALPIALLLALLPACVTQNRLFAWGDYDDALYAHHKAPQDRAAFVERLRKVVLQAEQEGKKVPPGVYAEFGYALLEEGSYDQAVTWFQKERDLWPESRVFMEKMIRNAQRLGAQGAKPAGQGPASAVEAKP
jgi:hypothetical protein